MASLPPPTPQTFVAIFHQQAALRASENRQLIALAAPAASAPAVHTFINDLRTKAAIDAAFFSDVIQGMPQAARQLARRGLVLAPQWWQHAGRLGAPDCGAVWVPAGPTIAAYGH